MPSSDTFHHIGILTRNLEESLHLYQEVFHYKRITGPIRIGELDIQVAHLEHDNAPRVELVQPLNPASTLGRMAVGASTGYHLAWEVVDLDDARQRLGNIGFHALPTFASSLWNGARCAFSVGPTQELVELVERLPSH
jgi:catechol 2,3-dioxygenase-like lactoylglutathione lyase family enzyme